jgi:hypothetical protein
MDQEEEWTEGEVSLMSLGVIRVCEVSVEAKSLESMERDIHLFLSVVLPLFLGVEDRMDELPFAVLRDKGIFCSEKCFWKRAILSRTEVKGKSYSTPGLSILDSSILLTVTLLSSNEDREESSV